jgi:hypothetical protein
MTVGVPASQQPGITGGMHMGSMTITQAAGNRSYSLHWRNGHVAGGHPTVYGRLLRNRSMVPDGSTPHLAWGVDLNGTVSTSNYSSWGTRGRAPDPCSWITFCTSCCAEPGPGCCCVVPGAPPLPPPGDCGSVKHKHPCDTQQPRTVHWCKHPFCP